MNAPFWFLCYVRKLSILGLSTLYCNLLVKFVYIQFHVIDIFSFFSFHVISICFWPIMVTCIFLKSAFHFQQPRFVFFPFFAFLPWSTWLRLLFTSLVIYSYLITYFMKWIKIGWLLSVSTLLKPISPNFLKTSTME